MTSVELKNVTVSFGAGRALEKINLKVKKGEFITILGSNGSGKTTILKTILGFNKCAGEVLVEGEKITPKNAHELRKKISYMPQSFDVDRAFPMLAGDVIKLGALTPERTARAAAEFGLEKLLSRPFGRLSGGEKQKVMLAMVLARGPEILLLDEPNLNLDLMAYKNFLKAVDNIYKKRRLTVLFVTHLVSHTPKQSGKTAVLKQGRLVFFGCKKKLLAKKNFMEFVYD